MPVKKKIKRGRPIGSKTTRSIAGSKAHKNGLAFEMTVQAVCRRYELMHAAKIEKTPEPFKVVKSLGAGRFSGHFEKAAQPDFKGCITGGRLVVFDAKHTEAQRIELKAVSPEQWKCLTEYEALGAICFIFISMPDKKSALKINNYKVPWSVWTTWEKEQNKKSMNAGDLQQFAVELTKVLDPEIAAARKEKPATTTPPLPAQDAKAKLEKAVAALETVGNALKKASEDKSLGPALEAEFKFIKNNDYCLKCALCNFAADKKYCTACDPPRLITEPVHRGQCQDYIEK